MSSRPTFRRNLLLASSESKSKPNRRPARSNKEGEQVAYSISSFLQWRSFQSSYSSSGFCRFFWVPLQADIGTTSLCLLFSSVACLPYVSILKMEGVYSSETSVKYRNARRHIPEHSTLNYIIKQFAMKAYGRVEV
jgi:hypothetical protein